MSHLSLVIGVVLGLHCCCVLGAPNSDLLSDYSDPQQSQSPSGQQQQQSRGLEYALKRGLLQLPSEGLLTLDSRERRAAGSGMGSSFIRFGRNGGMEAVSQPHTRSDVIIRYGRDGLNGRLSQLRQARISRLARLALLCAAKNQEDAPASSAEEKIIRAICKDAPLHPTVPDFV